MNNFKENRNFDYIIDLNEKKLRSELSDWSREDLMAWLKWNDSNGIYEDEESLDEIGHIMSYEEGVNIIVRQVIQKQ